jgi:broad-specificity NMP kinase
MPYIPQKDRDKFKGSLSILKNDLIDSGRKPLAVGELNLIISTLIWGIFDQHPSYTLGNDLVGVLECVKAEFIRRRLNPYEDKKIQENGDL